MSLRALALLCPLLAAPWAEARDLSGELIYRERIALPEDAEWAVAGHGAGRRPPGDAPARRRGAGAPALHPDPARGRGPDADRRGVSGGAADLGGGPAARGRCADDRASAPPLARGGGAAPALRRAGRGAAGGGRPRPVVSGPRSGGVARRDHRLGRALWRRGGHRDLDARQPRASDAGGRGSARMPAGDPAARPAADRARQRSRLGTAPWAGGGGVFARGGAARRRSAARPRRPPDRAGRAGRHAGPVFPAPTASAECRIRSASGWRPTGRI
jgi:hypothetical protein